MVGVTTVSPVAMEEEEEEGTVVEGMVEVEAMVVVEAMGEEVTTTAGAAHLTGGATNKRKENYYG